MLNITLPINGLSFGFVSYNILRELYNRGIHPNLFSIGNVDIASFDKISQDFRQWLESALGKAHKSYKKDQKEIRLWHINGAEQSHCHKQSLVTFYECDSPTPQEINILRNQESVFVSSEFTNDLFKSYGINSIYLPLGFDEENFGPIGKHPYNREKVIFTIAGKFESARKHTDRLIKLWIKKFGNNPKYILHLHCFNSHLHPDPNQCAAINQNLIAQCFEGKNIWNVNVVNRHMPTLSEYNIWLNQTDIFLDASGNEGWGVPAFHAAALGKQLVTVNSNAVKSWANGDNAILVEPNGKHDCYDNMFFHKGAPFNQGQFFNFSEDDFASAMDIAVGRVLNNQTNTEGLKLQTNFSWKNTVDILLEN